MNENKTTISIFIPRFLIQRSIMSKTDIKMCLILLLWKKPLQHRTLYEGLAGTVQACLAHAAGMRFLQRDEVSAGRKSLHQVPTGSRLLWSGDCLALPVCEGAEGNVEHFSAA